MSKYVNEDLLIKYLVGEVTEEEKSFVEKWIAESQDNEKQYRDLQLIWETSEKLLAESQVDENQAWDRFKEKLAVQQSTDADKQESTNKAIRRFPSWMKIAASLALVTIGIWLAYTAYHRSSLNQVVVATENNRLIDTLADGSMITLNQHSKVQYPKNFAKDQRRVSLLEGEAFFDIAPDSAKPFYVTINDIDVKVVGTSFNIKIHDDKTELIVETGVVEVSKQHVVVRLKRDEMVEVDNNSTEIQKHTVPDQLHQYYRTKLFIADETPLYRMVDVLSEAYGVEIVIEDKELENLELNTIFEDRSLSTILNVICKTFDIKMKKNGEQIVLYK